jgi:hypothetical protein
MDFQNKDFYHRRNNSIGSFNGFSLYSEDLELLKKFNKKKKRKESLSNIEEQLKKNELNDLMIRIKASIDTEKKTKFEKNKKIRKNILTILTNQSQIQEKIKKKEKVFYPVLSQKKVVKLHTSNSSTRSRPNSFSANPKKKFHTNSLNIQDSSKFIRRMPSNFNVIQGAYLV